jgi:uncharacterized DUF497 family protein
VDAEFDPAKDAANRRKHGVSLTLGAIVLAHLVGEVPDPDDHGGEERWRAYGLVGLRLYVCVYTPRGDRVRLISVRKATSAEEQAWLR